MALLPMRMERVDCLDYLMSSSEIKDILTSLGYKLSDRGKYWQCAAIHRDGDNQTALQIYKDTGIWKDYVQQTSYMPFKKLLQIALGTTDEKILKKYLKDDIDTVFNKIKSTEKIEMEKIYPESSLNKLLPHYKFYNERGIGSETLKFFRGGLATTGQMYQRFVFPVRNEHGQIHGFSGRDMTDSENRPKWKHIGTKSKWTYPLYMSPSIKTSIESTMEVILAESIGDMLNLHERGYHNCLVIFGLDISPSLLCSLTSLSLGNIVIATNNDSEKDYNRGLNSAVKNYLKLSSYFNYEKLSICLPTKNDFGDMDSSDFEEWVDKKSNLDKTRQMKQVLKKSIEMLNAGLLPKTFSAKVNKLKKVLS